MEGCGGSDREESPFMIEDQNCHNSQALAESLLRSIGCSGLVKTTPLAGGRNNRAYRVDLERRDKASKASGPDVWMMKHYFYDSSGGGRDRCHSEWVWNCFCHDVGVDVIPQPITCDPCAHTALFEFVDGRNLKPEEVDASHVEQAIAFVTDVNRHRQSTEAASIPDAAESCFSYQEHLDCIERRIHRLNSLQVADSLDQELKEWLQTDLEPIWSELSFSIERGIASNEHTKKLPQDERILSPSDFGFHNALLEETGRLRFFDFEYAGWDDPAKLVCDFYWQPRCPAPRETLPLWYAHGSLFGGGEGLRLRVNRLLPIYGIKWCCLILNEFLVADHQRRIFAQADHANHPEWKSSSPVTVESDRSRSDLARHTQFNLAKKVLAEVVKMITNGADNSI